MSIANTPGRTSQARNSHEVVSGSHFSPDVSEPLSRQPPAPCPTVGSSHCRCQGAAARSPGRGQICGPLAGRAHYPGLDYKAVRSQEDVDRACGCPEHVWQCWWPSGPMPSPLVLRLPGASALQGVSLEAPVPALGTGQVVRPAVTKPPCCCYGDGVGAFCLQPEFSA